MVSQVELDPVVQPDLVVVMELLVLQVAVDLLVLPVTLV
jgi:hypothetical protein